MTPVLNIVQTFLNERDLYSAVVDLPKTKEFIPLITKLATHAKFKYIESEFLSFSCRLQSPTFISLLANADHLVRNLPNIRKMVGGFFDVQKIFSNQQIFSSLGKILCGSPFPSSSNIRYVDNVLYSPDYNGADKDELDVMPSK